MAPLLGNILTLKFGTLRYLNKAATLFTSLSETGIVIFNQRQQRWERESTMNREPGKKSATNKNGKNEGGITCLHINRAPTSFACAKVSDDSDWL